MPQRNTSPSFEHRRRVTELMLQYGKRMRVATMAGVARQEN
jgi:hypothetical protein